MQINPETDISMIFVNKTRWVLLPNTYDTLAVKLLGEEERHGQISV
jgi:hypothetical protein